MSKIMISKAKLDEHFEIITEEKVYKEEVSDLMYLNLIELLVAIGLGIWLLFLLYPIGG